MKPVIISAVILALAALLVAILCLRDPGSPTVDVVPSGVPDGALHFTDVAPEVGLGVRLPGGSPEKLWILENIGMGCGLLDANRDGLLDVFVAHAGAVSGARLVPGPCGYFFEQTSDDQFIDRTSSWGLGLDGWTTGVAVGDYDNDGYPDLYLCSYGQDRLLRNDKGIRFEDVTGEIGIHTGGATVDSDFSTSAVFLDFDSDGFLDLYVARYVNFDPDAPPNAGQPCLLQGVEVACPPDLHDPLSDRLYRNVEGRGFVDVSRQAGIAQVEGAYGLGVAAGDLDGDDRPDIYVANDTSSNFLWRNVDGERFEDVALFSGTALSAQGQGEAGMGTDLGAAISAESLDVVVTNYAQESNAFYRNLGDGTFDNAGQTVGFALPSYLSLGWGVKLGDLDLDGDLDCVVANGHVYPRAAEIDSAMAYEQRCLFHLNTGVRFEEEGAALGEAARRPRAHRALALGDVDNDSDLDVLLTVLDGAPVLLRNDVGRHRQWISLRLEGVRSNRDAVGAKVWLEADGRTHFRGVTRGGSYLSSHDPRLHFGLGAANRADRVVVRWPDGTQETFGPLVAGTFHHLVEGQGMAVEPPRPAHEAADDR